MTQFSAGEAYIEMSIRQEGLIKDAKEIEEVLVSEKQKLELITDEADEAGSALSGAFEGTVEAAIKALAAIGALEAGLRLGASAAAIAKGDTEALEQSLRSIPFGAGAAIGALIDLRDILGEDTEAMAELREEWKKLASDIADTSSLGSASNFFLKINEEIDKLRGVSEDPLLMELSSQIGDINGHTLSIVDLRKALQDYLDTAGIANTELEKLNFGNSIESLKDGEIARGIAGIGGSIRESFGQLGEMRKFNALVDTLREAGIQSNFAVGALHELDLIIDRNGDTIHELRAKLDELFTERDVQSAMKWGQAAISFLQGRGDGGDASADRIRIRERERDALLKILEEELRAAERAEAEKTRAAADAAGRRQGLHDSIRDRELRLQGRDEEADRLRVNNQTREEIIDAINSGAGADEVKLIKELERLRLAQLEQDGNGGGGPESSITSVRAGIEQLQDSILGKEDQTLNKLEQQLNQAKQRDGFLGRIEQLIKNGINAQGPAVGR